MQRISPATFVAWQLAGFNTIHMLRQKQIEKEHIFLGITKLIDIPQDSLLSQLGIPEEAVMLITYETQIVRQIFDELEIDITDLRRQFRLHLEVGNAKIEDSILHRSPDCKKMFIDADSIKEKHGHSEINLNHLLCALLSEENNKVIEFLRFKKIDIEAIHSKLLVSLEKVPVHTSSPAHLDISPQKKSSSFISKIGRNLTTLAKKGKLEKIIGRDTEIKAVAQTLGRKKKNSAILIGDPGVGKTAVVAGLAQKIANEELTGKELKGLKIIEIRMGEIMAGAKYRGDLEERLMKLLKEAEHDRKLVIFIDEIHTIMQTGGGGGLLGVADIIKPALQSGEFRCIGATTFQNYKKNIESDSALQRRFQPIIIKEPTSDEALQILTGLKSLYEEHHGIQISDEAIQAAIFMSRRYLKDLYLPDKALDLLDEAASTMRIHGIESNTLNVKVLEASHIAEAVSKRTGIPVEVILCSDEERVKKLKEKIKKKIIGQPEAIQQVTDAIMEVKALGGIKNKPSGVFLFIGATGTGKTETAKVLADILFEEADGKLIIFDMSEYMEEHSASKLIGAPPGYVGHDEGGQLVEQVKRNPYSVILFDEIEKAHPKVFDIFLQIFDEARLTDGAGRKADFQNTYIILTSNIGSKIKPEKLKKPIGIQLPGKQEKDIKGFESYDKKLYKKKILGSTQKKFNPEFLGRIPHKILFYPLEPKDMKKIITNLLIPKIEERISVKKISLKIVENACQYLIEKCDFTYGVRNLIQLLRKEVTEPLTKAILDNRFDEGDEIVIRKKQNKIVFEKK